MDLITQNEIQIVDAAAQKLDNKRSSGGGLVAADVAQAVERAIQFLELSVTSDERSRSVRFLEEKYIVSLAAGGAEGGELVDRSISPWVPPSKAPQKWPFWYRYERYTSKKMSPTALQDLDDYTDRILNKLGDPEARVPGHPQRWDIRGLVAGHVQSGKTSNYIGLVCKAADAGYKMIVVLTGIHENLRVQTQERIDKGFIGRTAAGNPKDPNQPAGVGLISIPGVASAPWAFWGTTQNPGGDFRATSLSSFGVDIQANLPPVVLVVKKNASVLRTLLKWVVGLEMDALPGKAGKYEERLHPVPHHYRKGVPLLVIDDEADQASVDTAAGNIDEGGEANEEHNPTTINRLIRSLLRSFDRSAYVDTPLRRLRTCSSMMAAKPRCMVQTFFRGTSSSIYPPLQPTLDRIPSSA